MREVTILVLGAAVVCATFAQMFYFLYTRLSEVCEHLVKIIGLLQTERSQRAQLIAALNDHRK